MTPPARVLSTAIVSSSSFLMGLGTSPGHRKCERGLTTENLPRSPPSSPQPPQVIGRPHHTCQRLPEDLLNPTQDRPDGPRSQCPQAHPGVRPQLRGPQWTLPWPARMPTAGKHHQRMFIAFLASPSHSQHTTAQATCQAVLWEDPDSDGAHPVASRSAGSVSSSQLDASFLLSLAAGPWQ